MLPSSSPLLAGDELVGTTGEDLGGQVPALFATKGALDGERLERVLFPARRHVAAAQLALNDEGLAA